MLGAIAGDIIGSVFEANPIKTTQFPLFAKASHFTDDTVLTVAVADAILERRDYAVTMRAYGRRYPRAGYGVAFFQWIFADTAAAYNSWGNGSAMRVSPVGYAFDASEKVLAQAAQSAAVTHNHPEGIKGAQATALAIYMARHKKSKKEIRRAITERFGYDLKRTLNEIRPHYHFDVSCQGSVPEAIIAFLESADFEDAIRKAISLGGDSDTQACICGGIAQAFYGAVPDDIIREVKKRLSPQLLAVVEKFNQRYGLS